jgi:hypothetical protein
VFSGHAAENEVIRQVPLTEQHPPLKQIARQSPVISVVRVACSPIAEVQS